MKSLISRSIAVSLAAMLLMPGFSCSGHGDADKNDEGTDTATYTTRSDTVSDLYGRVTGQSLKNELTTYIEEYNDTAYSTEDFIAGLEKVAGKRRPMVFISGMTLGMRIESGDLPRLDNANVKIDREKVLRAIKTAMRADSTDMFEHSRRSQAFDIAVGRFAADTTSVALADSVAEAYGAMIGSGLAAELKMRGDVTDKDKTNFINGLDAVVGKGYSPEFFAGMSSGFNIVQNIASIEAKGLNIRREVVVDRIRKAFGSPALSDSELKSLRGRLNSVMTALFDEWSAREEERLATSDEAIQNIKTGEALVAKMKKANPEARTTASGLTYIIKDAGSGDRIKSGDKITAKYVGSHLDGKVFDSNNGATLDVDRMIPGFAEGLRMLGKGAKASFWIPGALGYKGRGVPEAGIGPMETLVFDVEILDVNP